MDGSFSQQKPEYGMKDEEEDFLKTDDGWMDACTYSCNIIPALSLVTLQCSGQQQQELRLTSTILSFPNQI